MDISLPGRLRALINQINPSAINSHLFTANCWTRASLIGTGHRVFVTEHSRDYWKSWYHRAIDRVLARVTNKLIAVSNDTAAFYRDEVGIDRSLITVINNGVDTARYAAGNGKQLRQQWLSGDEILLGTVGRLVPAKNHFRLLAMAANLKEQGLSFKLVIAGDGPEQAAIHTQVQSLKLEQQVLMLGQRMDIPDILNALDIFILSSDREGHPLTALEAQAAGTPVVLTNAGGSADAIARHADQRLGCLVDQSSQALADAVIKLINEAPSLEQRGQRAQQYALAHFDKRQMIDAYQQLFT